MTMRIYTYADPYSLRLADFGQEVCDAPHLTVSRVLANAMEKILDYKMKSLLCPIDEVLLSAFGHWHENPATRIAQYVKVSGWIQHLKERTPKPRWVDALKHNQDQLLDSVRLFLELGIESKDLDPSSASPEQKAFIDLLHYCESDTKDFVVLDPLTKVGPKWVSKVLSSTLEREIRAFDLSQENNRQKRNYLNSINKDFPTVSHVVIHGVHQFSPLQLRLINIFENIGIEIIFLHNYQEKFSNVYATWDDVYELWGAPVIRDTKFSTYRGHSTSYRLAVALGQLQQSNGLSDNMRKNWLEAAKDVTLLEFDNMTEYTNHVAQYFDDAIDSAGVPIMPSWGDKRLALDAMQEKVYTAEPMVHDLLRMYFPEYSGDRHFLHYPVGRFVMALFQMWTEERQEIRIDWETVEECASSGVLSRGKRRLSEALKNSAMMFSDVESFEGFVQRAEQYRELYQKVQFTYDYVGNYLKQISLYRPTVMTEKDIESVYGFVQELNRMAVQLFGLKEVTMQFGSHLRKLQELLKQDFSRGADEVELKLIEDLLSRLEVVSDTDVEGSMQDLRDAVYFYLKQKKSDDPNWIVRNVAQIEGDVLQSRRQVAAASLKGHELPVYHFAGLSDHAMNPTMDELLPWPLTEDFILKAYVPTSLQFQVYFRSLGEYGRFLYYSLFYGLCYNECDVRLSFVHNIDGEEVQMFYPLRLVGLQPVPQNVPEHFARLTLPSAPSNTQKVHLTTGTDFPYQLMDFLLCPYKFYLDFVLRDGIIIDNEFLLRHYYANMLVSIVAADKSVNQKEMSSALKVLQKATKVLRGYFPFWVEGRHFVDLQQEAQNYIQNQSIKDPLHMKRRRLFWRARWTHSDGDDHPYEHAVSSLIKKNEDNGERVYSLSRLQTKSGGLSELVFLNDTVKEYLEGGQDAAHPGPWCVACSHRDICLAPDLRGTELDNVEEE